MPGVTGWVHPWLRVARCVERTAGEGGPLAVAVPSDEGFRQLRRHGPAQLAAACPHAPAGVRFLDPGRADDVGGADAAGCLALFSAPWPDLPVILDRQADGATAQVVLRVPPDLRALRGHFAALPIVPGVVHLGWALHFARTELGVRGALAGMDQVKFRRIVQPGHRLVLSVRLEPQRGGLSFRLGTDEELFSAGRLALGAGHD